MEKRKPGRPYEPRLITLDEAIHYIRKVLRDRYPHISDEAVERLTISKKTLYNYRYNGKIKKYGNRICPLVDCRDLEKLVG